MYRTIIAAICTLFLLLSNAQADISPKLAEDLDKIIARDEAACREIIPENQYIPSERLIDKEIIANGKLKKLIYICGIQDETFHPKGDGKYVNAIVINENGLTFSVAKFKKVVDKYQKGTTVITHIIIDPASSLNELIDK